VYFKTSFDWTHAQELDFIELGESPARCLKGENPQQNGQRIKDDPTLRSRLVAGRALRALQARRVAQRPDSAGIMGRRPYWFQEAITDRVAAERDFERRRVAVREKKIAALQRERAQLKSTLRLVERVASRAIETGKTDAV
jgi:hypothetical protein